MPETPAPAPKGTTETTVNADPKGQSAKPGTIRVGDQDLTPEQLAKNYAEAQKKISEQGEALSRTSKDNEALTGRVALVEQANAKLLEIYEKYPEKQKKIEAILEAQEETGTEEDIDFGNDAMNKMFKEHRALLRKIEAMEKKDSTVALQAKTDDEVRFIVKEESDGLFAGKSPEDVTKILRTMFLEASKAKMDLKHWYIVTYEKDRIERAIRRHSKIDDERRATAADELGATMKGGTQVTAPAPKADGPPTAQEAMRRGAAIFEKGLREAK